MTRDKQSELESVLNKYALDEDLMREIRDLYDSATLKEMVPKLTDLMHNHKISASLVVELANLKRKTEQNG